MDKLLQDYKSYYATRAKRYEGNPIFHRSAIAEANLSNAMQGCSQLEEFKDRLGNLNQICATALTLDQSEYRARIFNELQEKVRAKGNSDVVEKCENIQDVNELIRHSTEIFLNNAKDIGKDEGTVTYFKSYLQYLESIDVMENSTFSSSYKSDIAKSCEKEKQDLKRIAAESLIEYQKYHPDFFYDWDGLWEHRHRKLIPIPDEVLTKRINQLKTILNS